MGLDTLFRRCIVLADRLTGDLQVPVVHTPFASRSATGVPTYGAPTTRMAIVEKKRRAYQGIIAQGTVTFLSDVSLSLDDRLTLPGNDVVTILGCTQTLDPEGGGYITEVYLGPSPHSA